MVQRGWLKSWRRRRLTEAPSEQVEPDSLTKSASVMREVADFGNRWSQLAAKPVFKPFSYVGEQPSVEEDERSEFIKNYPMDSYSSNLSDIGVIAFIGPSGTGKSTRATSLAAKYGIGYLIDDGLLIHGGRIVAGTSAKRASTKIESVRRAIFADPTSAGNMRRVLAEHAPPSLMILGTSESMLEKICKNLGLNQPAMRIKIEDITTESERLTARHIRLTEGKHTIPVPSMEIKHEFSGSFLDPLLKFRRRFDRHQEKLSHLPEGERTVVRPTFSTLGKYSLSDEALGMLTGIVVCEIDGVEEMNDFSVKQQSYGATIDVDLTLRYGCNAQELLRKAQSHVGAKLEEITAINIVAINLRAVRVSGAVRSIRNN